MNYKCLNANSNIKLSELGFGCASIWGKTFFSEEKAMELFFEAYKLGINFFDTGFSYDDAENRLGKCIAQLGNEKRKDLVIATKCGTKQDENGRYYHDWNIDWLKQSVEISLKRLNTSYVDMLHLHGPEISDLKDNVIYFLEDLKKQGITKAIGVNSFDTDVLNYVCDNKQFDFVMLDYNIMRQDREGMIKKLYDNKIGVIGGAALAQSLYSNRIFKIHTKTDVWYLLRALKNWRKHIILGKKFRFINSVDGITGNQVALRYVLDNPYITSSVFGTSNIEHLWENCMTIKKNIPENIIMKIKNEYKDYNENLDRK